MFTRSIRIIIPFAMLLVPVFAFAQEEDKSDLGSHHMHPGFEVVVSGIIIDNPEEGHTDPSTEVHVTYWTNHRWAFGVGYSFVFEEHGRVGNEVAALISHKPWSILTLNAGPSFTLPNSESDFEVSAYFEGELNLRIGQKGFHTGPVLGTLVGESFRYFFGVHFGYEF